MSLRSRADPSNHWWGSLLYGLVILALALPLIMPLLRWDAVPCTHDGHLHYHRIAAMRYAWENGLRFSRWLPDVAFGYGYPFFNYREALPLYLSLWPHMLGLALPAAINLVYLLSIVFSGWFMFLWARDVFGPVAGLVSAVAYMAAPYQLIDALIRGNQPESMALALFPLLGWAGRRFIKHGTAVYFLISVTSLGVLILSHNISALIFVPFLFVYLLAVAWWQRLHWQDAALRLGLLFGLGLAVSSFYIGPALLELKEITISQSVSARGNDFHFNFATLEEIVGPVRTANPSLINPPLLIRLGWVPLILALLGVISVLWFKTHERRGHIVFMALATLAFLFMSLGESLFLWENVPLIPFVQFPWRFIGRAALPVAFLAGVPLAVLPKLLPERAKIDIGMPVLTSLAIVLLSLEAVPMLFPQSCREDVRPTIKSVHDYEHNSGLVGIDPAGSYFPKTVQQRPSGSPLEIDYQNGLVPQRFDRTALPQGAIIEDIQHGALSDQIAINSPTSFIGRYLAFSFPGWSVEVDGKPALIRPSEPEGLITFPIPAGEHIVDVRWRMTPLRLAMGFVSLAALVGIAVETVALARKKSAWSSSGDELTFQKEQRIVTDQLPATTNRRLIITLLMVLLVALALFTFRLFVLDRVETPFRRDAVPKVSYPAELIANELRLEGYNLNQKSVAAGDTFDIDMAWRVLEPPVADYQSNIWLVGPEGMTWTDKETQRPRIYEDANPTRMWLPGQWAWDSREVLVLTGTPPGNYDLVLTMFDKADLQPLTLTQPGDTVVGPTAVLGQVEVVRPESPPIFKPQSPLQITIDGLTMLGFDQDRSEALPGDHLLLTFYWEKPAADKSINQGHTQPSDPNMNLELLDEEDQVAQSWLLPPVRSDYQPADWQAGERLRGQHQLRLNATIEEGNYLFSLEGNPLGKLKVIGLNRLLEEPTYDTAVNVQFGDSIEMVGYTLDMPISDPQSPTTITVVWKGLGEIPVSYRVFVHLIDPEGTIFDQSDAEPADWMRPTTGWAMGEYIIDEHQLMLPEGVGVENLSLKIGLYDARTGERLQASGVDSIVIPLTQTIP